MTGSPHLHEFDPRSPEALTAIETVEALPYSLAFEHLMYDSRLERTATYEYAHKKDDEDDESPIHLSPDLMLTQFPHALKSAFLNVDYTISKLKILQVDGKKQSDDPKEEDTVMTMLQFETNGIEHTFNVNNETGVHQTLSESLEEVTYPTSKEEVLGLAASLLYARQYDPTQRGKQIELAELALSSDRAPETQLFEQIIMTLGDHKGHSTIETRAIFEGATGNPVYALLKEQEYPDKSAVGNTLQLSEIADVNNLTTIIEMRLLQSVVNIEQGTEVIPAGQLSNRYAEQSSTVLNALGVPAIETIDPRVNYSRWAHACVHFLSIIKKSIEPYAHLDDVVLD